MFYGINLLAHLRKISKEADNGKCFDTFLLRTIWEETYELKK